MCIEISSRGYNKKEPESIDRETSIVWEKVMRTIWAEKITQKNIAIDLALPDREVNDLIFGMVATKTISQINQKPLSLVTK